MSTKMAATAYDYSGYHQHPHLHHHHYHPHPHQLGEPISSSQQQQQQQQPPAASSPATTAASTATTVNATTTAPTPTPPTHLDILHKVLQHGMLPAAEATSSPPQITTSTQEANKPQYSSYYPTAAATTATSQAFSASTPTPQQHQTADYGLISSNNRTSMCTPPPIGQHQPPTLIGLPQPTVGMVAASVGDPLQPFGLAPSSTPSPAAAAAVAAAAAASLIAAAAASATKPASRYPASAYDDLTNPSQYQTPRKHYGSTYATNEIGQSPSPFVSSEMPHQHQQYVSQQYPYHHHHNHQTPPPNHHHHRYSTYTPVCFLHEAQQQIEKEAAARKFINNTSVTANMSNNGGAALKHASGTEISGANTSTAATPTQSTSAAATTAKMSLTEQQADGGGANGTSLYVNHQQVMPNKRHSLHIDSYLTATPNNLRSVLGQSGSGNNGSNNSEVRSSNEKLLSYSYYTNLNYEKTTKTPNRPKLLSLNNEPSTANNSITMDSTDQLNMSSSSHHQQQQQQSQQSQQQKPKPTANITSFGALVGSINKDRKSKSINNVSTDRPLSTSTVGATTNVAGALGSSNNGATVLQSQSQQPTSTTSSQQHSQSKPHHQESPLYQKIMSRLSELPDSVLLRNYASNPGNLQALSKFGEQKSSTTSSNAANSSGLNRTSFASTIDENLKMAGQLNGNIKSLNTNKQPLAPTPPPMTTSLFHQPPQATSSGGAIKPSLPTSSMASNLSAMTTSVATTATAPPAINDYFQQQQQQKPYIHHTHHHGHHMSSGTPTPAQMQAGGPANMSSTSTGAASALAAANQGVSNQGSSQSNQATSHHPHYTTSSLPAIRITQKSLKAYAKGNLIVLKKSDSPIPPQATTSTSSTQQQQQQQQHRASETPTTTTVPQTPTPTQTTTQSNNTNTNNTNKYISTIRITAPSNTISEATSHHFRDFANNINNASSSLREQRRYKHKSLYLEPPFGATVPTPSDLLGLSAALQQHQQQQKTSLSVREGPSNNNTNTNTTGLRALTPASIIDVNYRDERNRSDAQKHGNISTNTTAAANSNGFTTGNSSNNKTSIYVESVSRTPVPFSVNYSQNHHHHHPTSGSNNSASSNKPHAATYRIQDLVFRDDELKSSDKKPSNEQQYNHQPKPSQTQHQQTPTYKLASTNNNTSNNTSTSTNDNNNKYANKLSITNAFSSMEKELNNLNSAFTPAYLTTGNVSGGKTATTTSNEQSSKTATTQNSNVSTNNNTITTNITSPISFANFKLSQGQNAREFLYNNNVNNIKDNKHSLRTKRYSQLVDSNENYDYNRNHPLIDNLIIHVENNKDANKLTKEEALQEIVKLTKYDHHQVTSNAAATAAAIATAAKAVTTTVTTTTTTSSSSKPTSTPTTTTMTSEAKKAADSNITTTTVTSETLVATIATATRSSKTPIFELVSLAANRKQSQQPKETTASANEVVANNNVGGENTKSSNNTVVSAKVEVRDHSPVVLVKEPEVVENKASSNSNGMVKSEPQTQQTPTNQQPASETTQNTNNNKSKPTRNNTTLKSNSSNKNDDKTDKTPTVKPVKEAEKPTSTSSSSSSSRGTSTSSSSTSSSSSSEKLKTTKKEPQPHDEVSEDVQCTEEIERAAEFGQSSNDEEDSLGSSVDDVDDVDEDDDDENELLDSFRKVDLKKFDVKNINFVPIDAINTAKILSNYPVHYGSVAINNPPSGKSKERRTATPPSTTVRPTSKVGEPVKQGKSDGSAAVKVKSSRKESVAANNSNLLSSDLSEENSIRSVSLRHNSSQYATLNTNDKSTSEESCPTTTQTTTANNNNLFNGGKADQKSSGGRVKATSSGGEVHHSEEVNARGLRKISTPPPLPHILDHHHGYNGGSSIITGGGSVKITGAAKFNRLFINQSEMSKLDALHQLHQGGSRLAAAAVATNKQSITSSIREAAGRDNKALRVNHGLPPPPPPPPPVVVTSTVSTSSNATNRQSLNGTPVAGLNSNEQLLNVGSSNKTTSSSTEKTRKQTTTLSGNTTNNGYKTSNYNTNYHSINGDSSTNKHNGSADPLIQIREQPRPKSCAAQPIEACRKASNNGDQTPPPTANNLIKMAKREDKTNNTTNLPQLDRIDYVLRTNDEKILTNITPYSEEKKPSSNKPTRNQVTSAAVKALAQFTSAESSRRHSSKQQQQQQYQQPPPPLFTHNHHHHHVTAAAAAHHNHMMGQFYAVTNDHRAEYMMPPNYANNNNDHSPLPWSVKESKNGKNFYENYARENDRRKREGNGFLMLLPGIAIPIDTDAGDSDDASSSN